MICSMHAAAFYSIRHTFLFFWAFEELCSRSAGLVMVVYSESTILFITRHRVYAGIESPSNFLFIQSEFVVGTALRP